MKKVFTKTNSLVVLVFMLIACLIGATTLTLTAHAQEEEPTSTVEITSFTTVMKVDETFQFAALVTNEDGTTSTNVTWSSSNEEIIYIGNDEEVGVGLAYAFAEGNATITATAADGASASVDVYVSNSAIHAQSIELYPNVLQLSVGWKTRIGYTIFPDDATDQRVTWSSSRPAVISVDQNGNVEALANGIAIISATTYDGGLVATCDVVVHEHYEEATLTPSVLTTMIGQVENNKMELVLPDGVTAEENSIHWYSMDDTIASIDPNADTTGTIYSWNFGTTTIYAVAADSEGNLYGAMGTVHVTAEFYYLTGLEEVPGDTTDPQYPWVTYETAAEAQAAGVLLVQDANNPYVYSLSRSLWAYDNFQIIHNDMDTDWTTRITSRAFNEEGSSMTYIANDEETFAVNALGTYTITLDLSDGRAKVTIEMDTLEVTSFDISVNAESKPYLQGEGDTMTLDVYTIPENATINVANVEVTLPASIGDMVTATPRVVSGGEDGNDKLYIDLTLNTAPASNTTFDLDLRIKNAIDYATDSIKITVLADGETYVPVSGISFNGETYLVNVNNGATPWISSTPLNATVNTNASVQDVVYTEESENIYIEYREVENEEGELELKPFVHAAALGTYTIYATSLGADEEGNTYSTQTTVLVTSLIETEVEGETTYSTGFYLIGMLDGEEVEGWTSIDPTKTDFTGSAFADWTLTLNAENHAIYSNTFNLRANDRFSIAFLGMAGNWDGIINNQYMNWDDSVGTYWENGINIEMSENGRYTVTLNLSGERPSFTIERIGDYNPDVAYRMWLYVVRSGDAWDAAVSEAANVIARVGYIDILNGEAQTGLVLTSEEIDFYQFYLENHGDVWPTIQFVTAIDWEYPTTEVDNYGIIGGSFQSPTWYGEAHQGVSFSGSAYSASGEADHFTNYLGRSELYWVSSVAGEIPETMKDSMTVTFTFTFDEGGVLESVALNFATSQEVPAE